MSSLSADAWPDLIRQTLGCYDETLLRRVAGKLCKPRGQWPVAELIDRSLEVLQNPAMLDRRLKELLPAARQTLALIGHSRQPRWPVGSLVEILTALGHDDGLAPVQALLDTGLLLPVLAEKTRLKHFDHWFGQAMPPLVQAPPAVTQRTLGEPLPLAFPETLALDGTVHEADGLEWPLRLAALWQQLVGAPLRRTQQRDLFKRDLDRLRNDGLLGAKPAEAMSDLPDPGLFTTALGLALGLIEDRDGDLIAGAFSPAWSHQARALLGELLAALPRVEAWNPALGWEPDGAGGNPYPAAQLLSLLVLASLPDGAWALPDAVESWVLQRHPYWNPGGDRQQNRVSSRGEKKPPAGAAGVARFLLSIAYPLQLVQACKSPEGAWAVRLSPVGRWLLGYGEAPPQHTVYPQTLLVQPNLEVLAYRQGLTPELIVKLTRFATWRTLGAACTLQLEPSSVYRALEAGETLTSIVQALERHGMKPTPTPVLDALKTWSNKRERLSVFPSAVVLEFSSPDDLQAALARGLPAVRLTDRLAAVANESQIDFKHFRLTGTRDYCLPPEPCVDVEADGVTLSLDLARTDLLLEIELQRFAEPVPSNQGPGRRAYRLTPASLLAARNEGLSLSVLATWFEQRTGLPLSPAARLLYAAGDAPPGELRRRLVLQVPTAEVADGLVQWPGTAALIQDRLGPTTLAVAEDFMPRLLERLQELGMRVVCEM